MNNANLISTTPNWVEKKKAWQAYTEKFSSAHLLLNLQFA